MWVTYVGLGGGKVGTRFRVWSENWMVWVAWRAINKLHGGPLTSCMEGH